MAKRKKTLTLTDKHIALIANIKFERFVLDDKQHFQQFKNMVNDLKLSENESYKETISSLEQENAELLFNSLTGEDFNEVIAE